MKYRQPGYRDSDYSEKRERGRKEDGKARQEARKVRHGMQRDASVVMRCADCGHQTASQIQVSSDTVCEHCGSPLHNCRNCHFLDTRARYECRQPIPKLIPSKVAANTFLCIRLC